MRFRRNSIYTRLLSHPVSIILMTCCFFDKASASRNPQYEACKREICGNVSLKYPFWTKSNWCGLSGFQLGCDSGQPFLGLGFGHYFIQRSESIHYEQQFVELKADTACLPNFRYSESPPPSTSPDNAEPGLIYLEKGVSNLSAEVHFFYHCNLTSSLPDAIPFNCSENEVHPAYVALIPLPGQEPQGPVTMKSACRYHFFVKVELETSDFNGLTKTVDYKRFYKDNFMLHWTEVTGEQCRACQSSDGECGQSGEDVFQCFCFDHQDPKSCTAGKISTPLKIGLGAGIGTLAIAVILLTVFVIRYRRMHASLKALSNNYSSAGNSLMSELAGSHVYFEVPVFQDKELEEATNNFDPSRELGNGGFGTVYYGKLRDGREVAVKRLYEHNSRLVKQFLTEVRILALLQHKNLVSLYGCTSRLSHKLLLVYEYVPNGTLADHLHGDQSEHGLLSWHIRMNIAIEAATALVYLHASDIIHRDVKTNNILLDNNFGVKVGDFGLSRLFPNNLTHISTAPQGTPGYMDPEYHQCYQLTEKSDVYSFGVVLVELVSSLPAVDITRERHEINLANLATNRIQKRAFHELIDPSLGFDSDAGIREKITGVAELAFICLQQEKEMRPSMFTVLEELKAIASETEVVGRSRTFPPCQESDKAALLKNMSHSSPISVAQKWISSSSSCSPSMSARE